MSLSAPVGVALLGCGTVGGGVALELLRRQDAIAARGGQRYVLLGIAVRSREKARPAGLERKLFVDDAAALVDDPRVGLVIECIGGTEVARDLVRRALGAGKHVVTANKDLLAREGPALRALAAANGATIAYEAAVGGAIPIVRTLTEALSGERILEVGGVLNGTTNFILGEVESGSSYEGALARAQRLGYAEADPTSDVEGIDAAHKLAILMQLAFRRAVTTTDVPRRGITEVSRDDASLAKRLRMTLKLLAVARESAAVVTPAYVQREHPFAQPSGPHNCIRVIGVGSGSLTFAGAGAGEPTASSVIADVIAALRTIAGGSAPAPSDLSLEAEAVSRLPLRHIVRLVSFRDARPARDALEAAGIACELQEGAPALLTGAPSSSPESAVAALRDAGIVPDSVLPLWEDAPILTPPVTTQSAFDLAIAQPAERLP